MEQASQGRITQGLQRMIFRGPLAKYLQQEAQVLPPVVALLLEFAAFASIPLLFMAYLFFTQESSGALPADLHGVWKTSAPRYADRYMEISEGVILFGTGGDSLESYVIDSVEVQPNGTRTLYTITYLDGNNEELRLSFYYDPDATRLITFKHQDHLKWTRVRE